MSKWPTHRPYSYKRLQYRLLIWSGYEYELYFEDSSIRRFINMSEEDIKDIVQLLNIAYSLAIESASRWNIEQATQGASMPSEHTAESVYETFLHIDQGLCTNAVFSNANVVMISKELYDTLIEGQQK